MSRTKNERNKHNKFFNTPKRIAKLASKTLRRAHGARLVKVLENAEDADDVEMPIDLHKDAGKGNIWNYD